MGRPPAEMSPELQDVLALYTAGYRPVEIAQRSGRTRAWANRAVQRLREMGAIDADQHVPTGRAKSGAVTVPVRLEADEVALVESVLREGETVRSFARTAVVELVTRRKLGQAG